MLAAWLLTTRDWREEKLHREQELVKSAHGAPVLRKHLFSTLSFTDKAYHAPECKNNSNNNKKTPNFLNLKKNKRKRKKENRKGPDPFS